MDRSSPCQSGTILHLLQGSDGEWQTSSLSCGFVSDNYHMIVFGMIQIIITVTIVASLCLLTYAPTCLYISDQ